MNLKSSDNTPPFHCGLPMESGDHISHNCLKCLVCGATSGCSDSLEQAAFKPKEQVETVIEAELEG